MKTQEHDTLCQYYFLKWPTHFFQTGFTLLWINLSEELRILPIYLKSLTIGQVNLDAD